MKQTELKNNLDSSLLVRFLSHETNEAENRVIYEWIHASPENQESFLQQKKVWDLVSAEGTNKHLDIAKDHQKVKTRIASILRSDRISKEWKSLSIRIAGAAAILLVLFFISWLSMPSLWKNLRQPSSGDFSEIVIPKGQRGQIILPDGTKVWINADSRLRYPVQFNVHSREVYLEGEAFFEVAHNKHKPFFVHTTSIDIKVLGTHFNVMSYPDDSKVETTVAEGCVSVSGKLLSHSAGTAPQKELKLLPNKKATFIKDKGAFDLKKVDAQNYTSWKDGNLCFREESLMDIAKKLERHFDVEITLKRPELKGYILHSDI
jgi:ferric-dicitrate binding protein FerR (iron transport regulator)